MDQTPEKEQTLTQHLGELRDRIFRIAIALVVGFAVAYVFRIPLFDILTAPVWTVLQKNGIRHLRVLDVTEAILMYLKVALIAGVLLTSPYTLNQVWRFVAPGLYKKERRAVFAVLFPSVLFFALGFLFAYAVMIPFAVDFLVSYALENPALAVELTVRSTVSFELTFLMVFAIVFELPLVMGFLSVIGIMTYKAYIRYARYALIVAFIIAALLTPPDVVSQSLMAGPLIGLYGCGVLASYIIHVRRTGKEGLPIRGFIRFGLVLLALLVPLYIWGLHPVIFGSSSAPATSLAWRDVRQTAADEEEESRARLVKVRYADGDELRFDEPPLVSALSIVRGHDLDEVEALTSRLACEGLCVWLSEPRETLRRTVPGLLPMASYIMEPYVAFHDLEGGGCRISLRFVYHASDPWVGFLLAEHVRRFRADMLAPDWARLERLSVTGGTKSFSLSGVLSYTDCRAPAQGLYEGSP